MTFTKALIFTAALASAQVLAVPMYSQDGHVAVDLEIEVFSFASVQDDLYLGQPRNSDVLSLSLDYENNTTNPAPGSASSFGNATVSAQLGRVTGVSDWTGLNPAPWFGHGGTASTIFSSAGFTIADITIDYRGVNPRGQTANGFVSASLHATTNMVGFGAHAVDIVADFTGDGPGGFAQSKRIVNTFDGTLSVSDQVTSFGGYTLPVNELFDLNMAVHVQSLSRSYPLLINEVGVKQRSFVNWSVQLGGSPAIILPEGYYANSADGSIVDNFFVGAQTSGPTGDVPTPSTFLLFLLGALLPAVRRIAR